MRRMEGLGGSTSNSVVVVTDCLRVIVPTLFSE